MTTIIVDANSAEVFVMVVIYCLFERDPARRKRRGYIDGCATGGCAIIYRKIGRAGYQPR